MSHSLQKKLIKWWDGSSYSNQKQEGKRFAGTDLPWISLCSSAFPPGASVSLPIPKVNLLITFPQSHVVSVLFLFLPSTLSRFFCRGSAFLQALSMSDSSVKLFINKLVFSVSWHINTVQRGSVSQHSGKSFALLKSCKSPLLLSIAQIKNCLLPSQHSLC